MTASFRDNHPDIPWAIIIATRNRLIHGYFDLDPDLVWRTVTKNLPELVDSIQPLVTDQE